MSESRRGTNPRYAGRGLWCEPASKRAPIATRRNPLKRQSKFTSVRGPYSMQPGTILVTSFCDESVYWASPTQGAQFGAISHLRTTSGEFRWLRPSIPMRIRPPSRPEMRAGVARDRAGTQAGHSGDAGPNRRGVEPATWLTRFAKSINGLMSAGVIDAATVVPSSGRASSERVRIASHFGGVFFRITFDIVGLGDTLPS